MSRTIFRMVGTGVVLVAVSVVGLSGGMALGQPWRPGSPQFGSRDVPTGTHRVRITYDGHIYLRMPNYDIALTGTPTLPGYTADERARVIFRNNQGSFWDGNRFFLSPSYRYGLVTQYDRSQHFIGSWRDQWPPIPRRTDTVGLTSSLSEPSAEIPRFVAAPNRSPVPLPSLPPIPYPPKKPKASAASSSDAQKPAVNDAFLEPDPVLRKYLPPPR